VLAGVEGDIKCEREEKIGETENGKKKEREIKEVKEEIACRR